jgi:hypothetical protein
VCIRYRSNVSTEPLLINDRVFLPIRFLAAIRGIFTKPLPSNDKGIFYRAFA